jgi:hypothetical protein
MPAMSVRLVSGATGALKTSRLIKRASSGVSAYFLTARCRSLGLVRLYRILVGNRDQSFVEKRISLTRHLHERAVVLGACLSSSTRIDRRLVVRKRRRLADRPPSSEIGHFERHQMQVETTLRILPGIAQLEQIEDRLNVGVKAVVTLARKRNISVRQLSDRFPACKRSSSASVATPSRAGLSPLLP